MKFAENFIKRGLKNKKKWKIIVLKCYAVNKQIYEKLTS